MWRSLGCVVCQPSAPVTASTRFSAQIVVFDIKIPMTIGFPVHALRRCRRMLIPVVLGDSAPFECDGGGQGRPARLHPA